MPTDKGGKQATRASLKEKAGEELLPEAEPVDFEKLTASEERMPPPPAKKRTQQKEDGRPDGSHRQQDFKVTMSPERLKHRNEELQQQAAAAAKETKLRALREGNFQAFSLATPKASPEKVSVSHFPASLGPKNLEELLEGTGSTSSDTKAEAEEKQQQQPKQNLPSSTFKDASVETTLKKLLQEVGGLRAEVATKADLATLQSDLLKATEELVQTKVKPLEEKLSKLSLEHEALKKKVASLEAGKQGDRQKADPADPAHKRVAFLNFPPALVPEQRLEAMREYCKKFPNHQPLAVANKYKGPYNDRKCSAHGYAEFSDRDSRNHFLTAAGGQDLQVQGATVKVKSAKTQFNSQRDYSLYKAEELLKAGLEGKTVTLERETRSVKVDGEVAFKQEKTEAAGTFLGAYSHFSLP